MDYAADTHILCDVQCYIHAVLGAFPPEEIRTPAAHTDTRRSRLQHAGIFLGNIICHI
jgi:hypothetical protein